MRTISKKLQGILFCAVFAVALMFTGQVEASADTVTISVERFVLGGSFIVKPTQVTITPGENYAELITRVLKTNGYSYGHTGTEKSGFYLSGIDGADCGMNGIPQCLYDMFNQRNESLPDRSMTNPKGLYEKCYMDSSGWMYAVNGGYPDRGMSDRYPKNNDVVRVQFTLNGGPDLTGRDYNVDTLSSGNILYYGYEIGNKTELVRQMGAYNSKGSLTSEQRNAYNYASTIMAKMNATEAETARAVIYLKNPSQAPSDPSTPSDPTSPSDPSGPSLTPDDPGASDVDQDTFEEGKPQVKVGLSDDQRSVVVSWNAYAGAESYEVRRKSGGAPVVIVSGEKGLSYTDNNVEPGKSYSYSVRAISTKWGGSAKSQDARYESVKVPAASSGSATQAKTPGKAAVSKVTAASYNSLTITWKTVKNATGYIVSRSTSKSKGYKTVGTVGADTTSFTDEGLSTGKTYYYKVQAVNDASSKTLKGKASAAKSGKCKLKKPAVTVAPEEKTAVVQWGQVDGADGYVVYRSTSKGKGYKSVKTVTDGATLSFTNTKLKSKKTYYYKVRAFRKVGGKRVYSAYSTAVGKKIQ